jgi:hypothetical protein
LEIATFLVAVVAVDKIQYKATHGRNFLEVIILTNACKAKGIFSFPTEMKKGGGRIDVVFDDTVQGARNIAAHDATVVAPHIHVCVTKKEYKCFNHWPSMQ